MQLSRDLSEFVASLNANDVRYLIVGGYAVAAHGHPRYTKDLDVWIEAAPDNARAVLAALRDFGFETPNLTVADLVAPRSVIQLGYPPNRIDLMTEADGVSFEDCYAARVVIELDHVPANFIDLDHLVRNKRASGRLQDRADIEALTGSAE